MNGSFLNNDESRLTLQDVIAANDGKKEIRSGDLSLSLDSVEEAKVSMKTLRNKAALQVEERKLAHVNVMLDTIEAYIFKVASPETIHGIELKDAYDVLRMVEAIEKMLKMVGNLLRPDSSDAYGNASNMKIGVQFTDGYGNTSTVITEVRTGGDGSG